MKIKAIAALFLQLIAALAATSAWGADFTLRIGAGHPPTLAYLQVADNFFIPEVTARAKKAGYDVRFIRAYSGTIAKVDGIVDAVQKGQLDIGLAATTFDTERGALFNMSYNVPFMVSDYLLQQRVASRMLREVPELRDSMKPYKIHVLSLAVFEEMGVISKTEISSLADLKWKKVGLSNSNAAMMAAVGATPVTMGGGEFYTAMQNGLLDGAIFFVSGYESFKLSEISKFYIRPVRAANIGLVAYMNTDTRQRLPKALVDIIDQTAEESALKTTELSMRRNEEATAKAKQLGVKITTLSPSDQKAWMEALKDFPAAEAKRQSANGLPGTKVMKAYIRMLNEEGFKLPITYPL